MSHFNKKGCNYKYDYFTIESFHHSYNARSYFTSFNDTYYKIILYNKNSKTYKKLYVNFDTIENISNLFNIHHSFNITIDNQQYYAYDILDVLCNFERYEDLYENFIYTKLGNLILNNIVYKDFEE